MKFYNTGRWFFALLAFSVSCADQSATETKSDAAIGDTINSKDTMLVFEKLVGIWKNKNGKSFERWTKENNSTYRSVVFSVNDNDTSWNENATIKPEAGKWVFENLVKDQNDGKPVRFTSLFVNGNSVQFSNPVHDFPTDINYTLADINTLNAFIAGPAGQGPKDTIPFFYTRLK